MTNSPQLPFPVALWEEHPLQLAAGTLTSLVPYKTSTGYWVLLPLGTAPAGATQGAVKDSGSGYDLLDNTTTTGKRLMRSPGGTVFTLP